MARFFDAYADYRDYCLSAPWIEKPTVAISDQIPATVGYLRLARELIYPNHPYSRSEDEEIFDKAREVLQKSYLGVDLEFQHGHFSYDDVRQQGEWVVLLSNLYWSWRPPLYDAIFGYHWFIYHLGNVHGMTPAKFEQQRELLLNRINQIPREQRKDPRLLKLAMLERTTAGLAIDAFTGNPTSPVAEYLVTATRRELEKLIDELGR